VVRVRGTAGEPGKTMGSIRCFRKRKNNVSGQGGRKAYFWWTETYFATATDHTSSNIISRDKESDECHAYSKWKKLLVIGNVSR
jgi:hypothetical protein